MSPFERMEKTYAWCLRKNVREIGSFHQPNEKREIDDIIAAVHAQLDEATFQAAWAEGRELTPEQAVARVLDE